MNDAVLPYLRCPNCSAPLSAAGSGPGPGSLRCARGHNFDIAKQGYATLTAGRSPHGGDSPEMVADRAAFLTAGHYAFIADALTKAALTAAALTTPALTTATLGTATPVTATKPTTDGLIVDARVGTDGTTADPDTETNRSTANPDTPTERTTADPAASTDHSPTRPDTPTKRTTTDPAASTDHSPTHPGARTDGSPTHPDTPTKRTTTDPAARADRSPTHPGAGTDGLIVDAGVGTGYYLGRVLDEQPAAVGLGLDVSKPALRRAARAHPRTSAALADLWRPLPLADASARLILNVFAPRNGSEFRRILRPDGRLLVVTPAADHLAELVDAHDLLHVDPDKADRVQESLGEGFAVVSRTTLRRAMHLSAAEIRVLVGMTPSARHLSTGDLTTADRIVTAAVDLTVYRPA